MVFFTRKNRESQHLLVLRSQDASKTTMLSWDCSSARCRQLRKVCDIILHSVVFGKDNMLMNHVIHWIWLMKILDNERCFHHQWELFWFLQSQIGCVQNFTAWWKHHINHILLPVLQRLSHEWWHYKQDKPSESDLLRHRTLCAPRRESNRWGRGAMTFHFHRLWNRLSAGMLASPLASPVCHVKAATNEKRMPILRCKNGDV